MTKLAWPSLRQRLKSIPGAVRAVRFVRSWLDPYERSLRLIRAMAPGQLLQPSLVTEPDRYPGFFAFVAERLAGVTEPQIMSFGCSTGEEVFSLRAHMPGARIVGLDINPRAIAACLRRTASLPRDSGIRFACKGHVEDEASASFDAIFCMAVLRHGDLQSGQPASCAAILDFAQVDRTVTKLARCVKPGGYLAIWNCHFRFADMAAAGLFEVVYSSRDGVWANQPLYGPDNWRLRTGSYCDAIFRKRAG